MPKQPPRRRPGRPRKPVTERKIARSIAGRLTWEPGMPHPLDVMFDAARDAHTQLATTIATLQEQLASMQIVLERGGGPDLLASDEERAARVSIGQRFAGKKHLEHLEATLAAIRRRRLAARLEITAAAIALATDLLSPITPSAEEELVALFDDEERTTRTTRQASAAAALIARLVAFEAQIQAQREHLARGGGWFELHYVTHERLNVPALRDAKVTGQQLTSDEMFITRRYGPYLEYRWREGKGPRYSVYLGDVPTEERETPSPPLSTDEISAT